MFTVPLDGLGYTQMDAAVGAVSGSRSRSAVSGRAESRFRGGMGRLFRLFPRAV